MGAQDETYLEQILPCLFGGSTSYLRSVLVFYLVDAVGSDLEVEGMVAQEGI